MTEYWNGHPKKNLLMGLFGAFVAGFIAGMVVMLALFQVLD